MQRETLRALLVLTSVDRTPAGAASGYWYEELAAPYHAFHDAGCDVTLASINGGLPPRDPLSEDEAWQTDATRRFGADRKAQAALAGSLPVARVSAADVDILFLVGGFGTMWDFPHCAPLHRLIEAVDRSNRTVASLCHGAAGFVGPSRGDGTPFIRARRMTCWSDEEERQIGTDKLMPFLLESRLAALGAEMQCGAPLTSVVRVDDRLVTGQNPMSAAATARAALEVAQALASKLSIAKPR